MARPFLDVGVVTVQAQLCEFTEDPKSALACMHYVKLTPETYHQTRCRLEQWYEWAKNQEHHPWFDPPLQEEPHYWYIEFYGGRGEIDLQRPVYQHDCEQCHFLGNCRGDEDDLVYDLYSCTKGPGPTLIARYGDEGHEYRSGAAFVGIDPVITEAARRHRNNARDFMHGY